MYKTAGTTSLILLGAVLIGMPALASPASPASAALGVIVQAENPRAEADLATTGSTIYDGDRLQTINGGTLRAQLGGSQMYLRANTTAQVHSLPQRIFSGTRRRHRGCFVDTGSDVPSTRRRR